MKIILFILSNNLSILIVDKMKKNQHLLFTDTKHLKDTSASSLNPKIAM